MLTVDNLNLSIGDARILKNVSLSIEPGKVLGIVGESGSGKSMTALSIMQLLPDASMTAGSIQFNGQELLYADDEVMQDLRGDDIAMIFQEPMTALNPVHTIGDQIAEGIMLHAKVDRQTARTRTIAMLQRVGLPVTHYPLSRYPHELSGGQRQRAMIAMACVQKPELLIADEPTTALDVTLQAQILKLLRELVEEQDMGLILISHDLAVVADITDELVVMRHGEIVDRGPTKAVLKAQKHPYTAQLAEASSHIPERSQQPIVSSLAKEAGLAPMLIATKLTRDYPVKRQSLLKPNPPFRAVDNVDLTIYPGQTMGLVGESGCGKSTLARMLLALDRPTSGSIRFDDVELTKASEKQLVAARRNMQVVFQDPYSSFNPRHKVERLVAEPLHLEKGIKGAEKRDRVVAALEEVGLPATALSKYPHQFSGGQRQRLAIARALITRPQLIVADEPVSALDVSIRAQVLDLLTELREKLGLAYIFISHDLSVVRALCDEVLVMEAGRIVEHGTASDIFDNPRSMAAKLLVAATPNLERSLRTRTDDEDGKEGEREDGQ
ncbi:MAG: dipeptide ABC transporter ATP-binding protein [Rhizobiaceae bacterium]